MARRPICTKSFSPKHEQLRQRARCASPGQRRSRQRELVIWLAKQMAPRLWKGRPA